MNKGVGVNRADSINAPLRFPERTTFNKIIAKEKIFQQSSASASIKRLFQKQVERIRCSYEMTAEKLNLKNDRSVPKILIIQIIARESIILNRKIFETIDKAFGVPVIFEIHYKDKLRYCACYRRRSESDKSKWVYSAYFESEDYIDCTDEDKRELPIVLNMSSLYEQLIKDFIPQSARTDENIRTLVSRASEIEIKEQEIIKLESRIKKEKQFNRKVELNGTLNELKQEITKLKTA